jgi:hypothetical protein
MTFYKHNKSDIIRYVDTPETEGPILFTFDGTNIFNFWTDYPDKLTDEQIEIFKHENPELAALKK